MGKFFDKLRDGMAAFMYGRNGVDALNMAIFALYLITLFVRAVVVATTINVSVYTFFNALAFALVLLFLFRALSRKLDKRQTENQHFLNWWLPKRQALRNWRCRRQDKAHQYIKCRHCGTRCRVPRGLGRIEITCPKCRQKFIKKT